MKGIGANSLELRVWIVTAIFEIQNSYSDILSVHLESNFYRVRDMFETDDCSISDGGLVQRMAQSRKNCLAPGGSRKADLMMLQDTAR